MEKDFLLQHMPSAVAASTVGQREDYSIEKK
jgi:hypothetical protein